MTIYDISLPISESLPPWPGDPDIRMTRRLQMDQGDPCTLTVLELGAHTGTHLDAPCHFVAGAPGVETLDLNVLVGQAYIVEVRGVDHIEPDLLDDLNIPAGTKRLLIRTDNSDRWDKGRKSFIRSMWP